MSDIKCDLSAYINATSQTGRSSHSLRTCHSSTKIVASLGKQTIKLRWQVSIPALAGFFAFLILLFVKIQGNVGACLASPLEQTASLSCALRSSIPRRDGAIKYDPDGWEYQSPMIGLLANNHTE